MTNNTAKIVTLLAVLIVSATMSGCIDSDNLGTSPSISTTTTPITTPTQVEIGTYYNPILINKVFTCNEDGFQIMISAISRGKEITNAISGANMFNSNPKSGYEYMMVAILFDNIGTDKHSLSSYEFTAYANNVECVDTFVVLPDDVLGEMELTTINIMPGGNIVATKVFEVPIGVQVTICYDRIFDTSYYFDVGSDPLTTVDFMESVEGIL